MARDVVDSQPVESKRDLVEWMASGEKPPAQFRVGSEHEKIPYYVAERTPVPYEGPRGIGAILKAMKDSLGWEPIEDAGKLIGLLDTKGGGAISLEPGGQFELSGALLDTIHESATELSRHLVAAHRAAGPLGVDFLGLGMSPKWTRGQTPVMPKSRYKIMSKYMPKVGSRGLDMMYRTATVQANLDFSSEADMVAKLRVGIALQPVLTALFANSPFTQGKPNGMLSERSNIWLDTDNARTGMLPFAFEPGMSYERYVDYALDVPMYFVKRGDVYHEVAGASFRDLMAGKLKGLKKQRATLSDWANHLSTIFPEVRLKRYLEMRGADVGPAERIVALSALMVGLFYDADSLAGAADLVKGWSAEMRQTLREEVPRLGLKAQIGGRLMRDVARDTLELSAAGLKRRARLDADGRDEAGYLRPLVEIAESGRTPAEIWLERYETVWGGSVDPVFVEAAL